MTLSRKIAFLAALLPVLGACAALHEDRESEAAPARLGARLADAMLKAGSPEAALRVADGMLAADPHDPAAKARRGRALLALGQVDEAAEALSEASKARPEDVTTARALARARGAAGDNAGAEAVWRGVLARSPGEPHALAGLAVALDLQTRHGEAQVIYRQLLRERPDDWATLTNLGLSLALSGQSRESLALLGRPGVSAQGPRARHDLAVALVLAGDEPQARMVLSQDLNAPDIDAAVNGVRTLGSI